MTTLGEAAVPTLRVVLLAILVVLLAATGQAAARPDNGGLTIPNTDLGDHLVSGPTVVTRLGEPAPDRAASADHPASPADDPAAVAALGRTASPEEDLAAALRDLAAATDEAAAAAARQRALAILEGAPVPGRAYSGLPLLNHDVVAARKTVSPTEPVVVREVRFGDHALVDAPLLDFADPDAPFTITYEVTELGGSLGGFLAPVALLKDTQGWIGGQHAVLQTLTSPLLSLGTTDTSRFHDAGAELTRLTTQRVTVEMPPPRYVTGVVSPNLRDGHETLATIRRADAQTEAALEAAYGTQTPSRTDAIAKIGDAAPEKQLWADLTAADPAVDLAAAKAVGANDAPMVDAMSDRDVLPSGLAVGMPAADVQAVIVNNEIYLSRSKVSLPPGSGPVTVAIRNGDELTRTVGAGELKGRSQVFGAIDWGQFDFGDLGTSRELAPGAVAELTLTPAPGAFALLIGDTLLGSEGAGVVELERGPRRETLRFAGDGDAPLHVAQGKDGEHWVTLEGIDTIARLRPGQTLADTAVERFPLPGGAHTPAATTPPLAPHDIAVDPNGIVWATLTLGNAIARIDPAQVKDGTGDGIKIFKLPGCNPECPPPFPPPPVPEPDTREPIQMHVSLDGEGNTNVWFNEAAQDAIGLLRVTPGGTQIQQEHFPCACGTPLGIDVSSTGDVWFTETIQNRIGRLRLDQAEPYKVSSVQLDHFRIPSGVLVTDPALGPDPVFTAEAHSIAIDAQDRVWFTESATGKLGRLDPDQASPNTTNGMQEFDLPDNDFGRPAVPADLTLDREGNVFWVDEYGDVVGERVAASGENRTWRPARRNSLTDSPMVDDQGDLYFLELGASTMTRLRGVSPGGALRPAAPPQVTTDLRDGSISATGLRATDRVDLVVLRGGTQVGSATNVPVTGGSFRAGNGGVAWTGQAPRPDDLVRITRTGQHQLSRIELRVPGLQATLEGGGVHGTARRLGRPVFGTVVLRTGDASRAGQIDPIDGTYTIGSEAVAGATITWTEGTPAAQLRTVAAVAGVPGGGGGGATGGSGGGDAGAGGGGTTTGTPAGPVARPPVSRPPTERPSSTPAPACTTTWLRRSGRSFTVPQLGLTAARARACLGRPASVRKLPGGRERWSLGGGVKLRLTRGKVTGIVLTRRGLTSAPDNLTVGSALSRMRTALGTGRLEARGRRWRATVRSGRRQVVVIATVSRLRVTALDVRLKGTR